MAKSFLLRFQEAQVVPETFDPRLAVATGTRIQGEQPDRVAYAGHDTLSNPRRDMETSTAVPSERPDYSAAGELCGVLPARPAAAINALPLAHGGNESPRDDHGENQTSIWLVEANVGTKTAVGGEQPDSSVAGESYIVLPQRTATEIVNSTLTYTFVNAEEPRKDERRRSALVLPACS